MSPFWRRKRTAAAGVPSREGDPADPVTEALLELDGVSRRYQMGSETIWALHEVSFTIRRGEFVAVIGASGSGKSTLLNLLGCLDTPSGGTYLLRGQDVRGLSDDELSDLRNREIGFVFQTFQLLARTTALENVELPLVYRGVSRRLRRERARRALERVGLASRMAHRPNELSGGQRQRVAIARALVTEPAILLADEPTGNLDSATGREILALFRELHGAGNTIILVTHEPAIAAQAARAIRLSDGRVVDDGPGARVAAATLAAAASSPAASSPAASSPASSPPAASSPASSPPAASSPASSPPAARLAAGAPERAEGG